MLAYAIQDAAPGMVANVALKPVAAPKPQGAPLICATGVNVSYDDTQALFDIHLDVPALQVTSLIGPSGCGKTTFLRCLNRMNDLIDTARVTGDITIGGKNIHDPDVDVVALRAQVGMVFQKPNPFPKSIFENVAYGLRINGLAGSKGELKDMVEANLKKVGLIDEVRGRLDASGTSLSGGQQQRLCIARTIAVRPKVILMDEPCSALDPIATARIEDLIGILSEKFTIIIVTHSMQQAARVSQQTAFFHLGNLVESGPTRKIFSAPEDERTANYVSGRIG